jgi:hypothetical protein
MQNFAKSRNTPWYPSSTTCDDECSPLPFVWMSRPLVNEWLIPYSYHSQDYQLCSSHVLQTQWLPGIYFLVSSHLLDGVKALEKFPNNSSFGQRNAKCKCVKEKFLVQTENFGSNLHRRFLHIYKLGSFHLRFITISTCKYCAIVVWLS